MNRRSFIERSAPGGRGRRPGAVGVGKFAGACGRVREAAGQERLNAPATRGSYYKAEVPDTLDLSVHAAYDGGYLITRPLVFTGRRLSLNYSTSAAGSVRVEPLNSFGRPVGGFSAAESQEIFGDELERTATWSGKSDAGALAGQPVRLRFLLRDADLYSFRFAE